MNKILLLGLVLFSAFATSQTKELSVTYSWIIKIYQACSLAKGCASSFEYNGSVPILVGNSAEKRDDLFTFNFSISQLNENQFTLDAIIDDKQINRYQFTEKLHINRPTNLFYKDDKIEIDGRLFITD